MNRRPVTSSNVASIGWEDETLEVEFVSGHIYQYQDVPEAAYRELLGADSIGRHMNQLQGKYQMMRVK
jgi:hypothetical protein